MKKIKAWHLKNCSTCQKIIQKLDLSSKNSILINIKEKNISKNELEEIQSFFRCSYEDLFNKRALKFRKIKDTFKTDLDYKKGILEEYTFLKRPIIQVKNKFFVGNSKKITEETQMCIEELS